MIFTYDARGYSCDCISGYTKVGLSLIGTQSCLSTSVSTPFVSIESAASVVTYSSGSVTSATFLHYFSIAATRCKYYGGAQDIPYCQILANLCVLQVYDSSSTVCSLFLSFITLRGYTSAAKSYASKSGWGTGLPWLYYSTTDSASACLDTNIKMKMSLKSTVLKYYVSVFTMNGTWLGYNNISTLFSYCTMIAPDTDQGGGTGASTKWQRFATSNSMTYKCNVNSLLSNQQYFYDLYVLDEGTGGLYPVPISITNLKWNGDTPNINLENKICSRSNIFVRRFFLFDIISGIPSTSTNNIPNVVRYLSDIKFSIQIQSSNPEYIYVPIVMLTYKDISQPITDSTVVSYTLTSIYTMDMTNYLSTEFAFIITALIIFIIIFFLRYSNWRGRNIRIITMMTRATDFSGLNVYLIVEVLALLCHSFTTVFFPLIVIESEYWFVFFKLQDTVAILLPPAGNIYTSTSAYYRFVILLHTLVFADLFYICKMVYQQAYSDIFFIDWEPLKESNTSNQNTPNTKVSVWRTILVANEWNEMQVMRRIDLTFTLFWVGFFLLGLNYQYYATEQPNLNDLSINKVNPILRFGNSLWWWFVSIAAQFLWRKLIYERFISEPRESQFIDFCTIAKVRCTYVKLLYVD